MAGLVAPARIDDYSAVREHLADRITLLCDRHHKEKTNGLLPTEQVEAANAAPFALQQGASSPYKLHFSGPTLLVTLGSNSVVFNAPQPGRRNVVLSSGTYVPISFVLSDGRALLSVDVRDQSGGSVVTVTDNELVFTATTWDVTLIGTTLTVRDGPGRFMLVLRFDPPSSLHIERGTIPTPRGALTINSGGVMTLPGGAQLSGCSVEDCGAGFGF